MNNSIQVWCLKDAEGILRPKAFLEIISERTQNSDAPYDTRGLDKVIEVGEKAVKCIIQEL